VSDINDKKTYEQELSRIAQHDALTNLPNRILLADRLNQAMIQVQRHGGHLAVVYLDLDGFKLINDNYGHDVGDELLVAVSNLMKLTLREGDTIARLGGDEFIAILIDLTCLDDVIPLLKRLLDVVSQPIVVDDLSLNVTASMGVSFYPQATLVDAEQLLRQADQAMYQAKLAGKNRYHIFDSKQDSMLREHFEMVEIMQKAIKKSEFVLFFQPKVNMRTGVITGAEALIRWQHPERGLLQPVDFLPIIEGHELSIAMGEWVLNTALTQMEAWQQVGLNIPVSVNITARQLKDESFVERLAAILAAHPKVDPSHLELEVLETSKLDNIAVTAQIMTSCKILGVSFSLDDFGTGYSSLAYLQRLPIRTIKIDQMFIRNMLHNEDDITILSGILSLASAFKRHIIAEGVETVEHGHQLLKMGCDCAQGYVIARPMPADDFVAWSKTWQPDASWQAIGASAA
jgi:diguanylate cyclase (GGDEF)-like protein